MDQNTCFICDIHGVKDFKGDYIQLPNMRGTVPISISDTDPLIGTHGGSKTHTLTVAQMASHRHHQSVSSYSGSHSRYMNSSNRNNSTQTSSSSGGNQPHNNIQPYITFKYYIKVNKNSDNTGCVIPVIG